MVLRLFPNCPFAAIPRNSAEIADEAATSAGSLNMERAAGGSIAWLDPLPMRQIKIEDKSNFLEFIWTSLRGAEFSGEFQDDGSCK